MSTVKKSPLTKGRSIEYKYKNKEWKNGFIKSKTNTHMIIIIHKNIFKQKEISLRMCDVITLLHIKKTLKLSNQIFPQWIAIHTAVKIKYPKAIAHYEFAKIAHYRDNKSITFYFPKQREEKRILTIKQRDIKTINEHTITTNDGTVIGMIYNDSQKIIRKEHTYLSNNDSLFTKVEHILKDLYDIPSEICIIICEYTICASIRLYSPMNYIKNTKSAKVWHANMVTVYGAEFKPFEDILSRGVEIYAKFGKVKTYTILWDGLRQYKGIMDTMYDEHDDIRRFIWEKEAVIKLSKGTVCKVGFFVSDGAAVTKYVKYLKSSPEILMVNKFEYIKWQFMNRNTNMKQWTPGYWRSGYEYIKDKETSYDWYPFVRLLV